MTLLLPGDRTPALLSSLRFSLAPSIRKYLLPFDSSRDISGPDISHKSEASDHQDRAQKPTLYLRQAAHLLESKADSCFRRRELQPATLDLLRPV